MVGTSVYGGHNLSPLVGIGLRWLPKLGVDMSPRPHVHRRACIKLLNAACSAHTVNGPHPEYLSNSDLDLETGTAWQCLTNRKPLGTALQPIGKQAESSLSSPKLELLLLLHTGRKRVNILSSTKAFVYHHFLQPIIP